MSDSETAEQTKWDGHTHRWPKGNTGVLTCPDCGHTLPAADVRGEEKRIKAGTTG